MPYLLISLALAALAQDIKTRDDGPYRPYEKIQSIDQAIQAYRDEIRKDPKVPGHHALLGQMLIQKARETGDTALYDQAEAAVSQALQLDAKNIHALIARTTLLNARHAFAASLQLARELYQQHPQMHKLLFAIGDAQLELGNVAEAEKAFADLERKDVEAYLLSRRARLAELKGDMKQAIALMQKARAEEAESQVSRVAGAWYEARLGEMHFNQGHLDAAATHYEAARKINPTYGVALAGLGRIQAARGKLDEAVEWYKQAVTHYADLHVLAELGDLYARTGNAFLARLNFDKLEQVGRKQPAFARELALYFANHDKDLPEALALARKDLAVRKDILAYDTLAWALHKNGQHAEAAKAMGEALKLGTQDASLFYHAGLIELALGNKEQGQSYLKRALALNPYFSLTQAEKAQQALDK